MSDLTKIEWCDATLNLWWGCTKVSEGCKFCYAEHLADHRHHKGNWGPTGTRTEVKSWRSTLNKISKRARAENRRLKVFCQSMSDTFEGPETMGGVDSENWALVERLRTDLFYEIPRHPHLDFLLLTKRPENVERTVRECWTAANSPQLLMCPNAWFGTSVENQATLHRIDELRNIPADVRFVSNEPALGDLGQVNLEGIHWWITGGESGPDARPMHPDWARSLRDQCQAAGVPFLFKQWGEWSPHWFDQAHRVRRQGATVVSELNGSAPMFKVGKARAGRLLDGREWNEFPEVRP